MTSVERWIKKGCCAICACTEYFPSGKKGVCKCRHKESEHFYETTEIVMQDIPGLESYKK